MNRAVRTLVLTSVAGFGHVIYPFYLLKRTSGATAPKPKQPEEWPALSVVVPAYLEAGVIRSKVDDALANGYPGEIEVVVVADDEETASAARGTAARVELSEVRAGKASALNRGIAAAAHEVVVFTDANTTLSPGALERLVRWLSDPTIAAVAGEKRVSGSDGESLYWKFESWLKQREFMTGTTIGLVGELGAIRKSAFRPLPSDVTNDDLWTAITVVADGGRIAYEPDAVATEDAQPLDEEWQRRTRIVAGALDVLWRQRSKLAPGATAATSQLWGHRLIRMTLGPIAHLALLRAAVRSMHRSRAARLFVMANAGAAWALVRQNRGEELTPLERAGAQALWLQGVALGGMWRFVRRDRTALWPKRDRSPSSSVARSAP
jgi:cellulose synthase/poly-beta-1,6-N-acetylglucosamine synthase-like glycosyltransferase